MTAAGAPRRESLNLRIRPADRSLIDRAAEEALMDQTLLVFSAEAHAEFLARLDAPPTRNERLQRMLNTPAPWE